MRFGELALDEALGAILAHAVMLPGLVLKKGRRLTSSDLAALRARGVERVMAAAIGPEDVAEDEAAKKLAAAVAGPGLRVDAPFTGRVNLFSEAHGLVLVDAASVDRLNARDEAITLATLAPYAAVSPRQMVATVKIIPFAVPRATLDDVLAIVGERPLVRVAAFRPLAVRLIQTVLPGTSAKMLDKTVRVTRERIEALGGRLLSETRCAHATAALAEAIAESGDPDLLLIAGASAITDRQDVLPSAIAASGGEVLHFGMPVDPGNLILLARRAGRPVLGLPGCARSPKLNGFDWVLQRLAAGLEVTPADITRMGVGGLLMEIPTRPQPRTIAEPPAAPKISALVLAAGQSRRMGGPNKLLVEIEGKPMLRRAVEAALAARLSPVVVVTGHMREAAEAAITGMPVEIVHNPDYAEGLSTSLRTGLAALSAETDAVLVCLADMPRITGRLIKKLIAAYNPVEGRAIVVPTHRCKRGNPVLWDRRFFAEMRTLAGDVGARHLIGQNEEAVAEVEVEDDAVLLDIDTPEALAGLRAPPA